MAENKMILNPEYLTTPGEILEEYLESMGMSQAELALRTGLTKKTINGIIKGKAALSPSTALKLEQTIGRPAHFWNNLEAQYREKLAEIQDYQRNQADIEWLKKIPVKELIQRGLVPQQKDKATQLREVLTFYGVSSVSSWNKVWKNPAVAARRSKCFESQPGAASAWLRQGELQAQKIYCQEYDRTLFKKTLQKIRELIVFDPQKFVPKMTTLCAQAGVALALVPEMKRVPWNGATKWLSKNKVMILLSLRGKSEDIFWFSFFHEAGHVLNDKKGDVLINTGKAVDDPREEKADKFAADFLIPAKYNQRILSCQSKNDLIQLAEELGISCGIVAGRYRYLTKKWNWFTPLIRKFQWDINA